MFKIRLKRFIKCLLIDVFPIFRTLFNILSILWSFVYLPFVECGIKLLIRNQVIDWTRDHFVSRGFHTSLWISFTILITRVLLFKVIIKLLCAHCFSSLCISFSQVEKVLPYLPPLLEINIWNTFSDVFLFLPPTFSLSFDLMPQYSLICSVKIADQNEKLLQLTGCPKSSFL